MTIDLDRCNGCSACVVACYAENNIPVVGKVRTALGREMSWIRMERYIEGYGDDFETRFSPMLCQHCGNAGCETVCPVYATYHNPEGLNAMVYNRCVGTRYCSNNCAYKVRRFNWFDYEFPAPLDQQLNPDVSVREKGVMEKCTFCIQRIRRAEVTVERRERSNLDHATMKKRNFLPACVSACPTNALNFADQADDSGPVKEYFDDVNEHPHGEAHDRKTRGYRLLEEMGTKPNVIYLKKVDPFPLRKGVGHGS